MQVPSFLFTILAAVDDHDLVGVLFMVMAKAAFFLAFIGVLSSITRNQCLQ